VEFLLHALRPTFILGLNWKMLRRIAMQKWMNRFALLAVLGGLMASALVVGCGGGEEEDAGTTGTTNGAAGGNATTP
jgi:hypothetical protein